MVVTREHLESELRSLAEQQRQYLAMAQQATGAIQAIRAMLSFLEAPEVPPEGQHGAAMAEKDFAELIAGEGARVEPVED